MTASARLFGIDDALDTDAWYTPPWIFEGMDLTFDLDVAAPSEPLPWIPAARSYTVAPDGLTRTRPTLMSWYPHLRRRVPSEYAQPAGDAA